jgi:hypothetical protein
MSTEAKAFPVRLLTYTDDDQPAISVGHLYGVKSELLVSN